jgi:hypothetical protein
VSMWLAMRMPHGHILFDLLSHSLSYARIPKQQHIYMYMYPLCGGYKTGLSHATFYRHAPYRDAAQPSYSSSFQDFLDKSGGAEFPTEALGGSTQNTGPSTVNLETVRVNFPF